MARTIYSKYSNERAKQFCIRTDIVKMEDGRKAVYKYALCEQGQGHIEHIRQAYGQLKEAYRNSEIVFCECKAEGDGIRFPFIKGDTLQDVLELAVKRNDIAAVTEIIKEYIRRIRKYGGNEAFVMTDSFAEVFGKAKLNTAMECAKISDIDMIFSNILVAWDETDTAEPDIQKTLFHVIDYEWTFDFPIPKDFMIYRALYFAYYQILNDTDCTLAQLFEIAGINRETENTFAAMEVQFQAYLGKGALPVRNMQRMLGTGIVSLEQLLENAAGNGGGRDGIVSEEEWIKVKKLQFHIDREEYQDGSVICCGWAFAKVKDGRILPVNIRAVDHMGCVLPAEIHRLKRQDVADALRLKNVTEAAWGFDCVWIAAPGQRWKLLFSLGNCEKEYWAGSGIKG